MESRILPPKGQAVGPRADCPPRPLPAQLPSASRKAPSVMSLAAYMCRSSPPICTMLSGEWQSGMLMSTPSSASSSVDSKQARSDPSSSHGRANNQLHYTRAPNPLVA